jgi:hypothetical protein
MQLIFRDQTKDVSRKVQRAKRVKRDKSVESITTPSPDATPCVPEQSAVELTLPCSAPNPASSFPSLDLQPQAFYCFFRNYVSPTSKHFTTIYENIPALYQASSQDSALLHVITALGLAGLSCHTSTSGLDNAASDSYNKALRRLNHNLADADSAREDMTLLVVLLLGLYEVCYTIIKLLEHAYRVADHYL